MKIQELLAQATRPFEARMVYGEPVERDGVTVVPAARVVGGGGGGDGEDNRGRRGEGGGMGLIARPVGAFVIRGGEARWEPAVDVNRVIGAVAAVLITVAVVLSRIMRARA